MKIGNAIQASHDGVGYDVSISSRCHVSTSTLGTIIGSAKKEQRLAGRTCFATSDSLAGLYFEPAQPAPLEALQADLKVLLESIGFATDKLVFTEETSPVLRRRPVLQSAPVVAHEQLLSA